MKIAVSIIGCRQVSPDDYQRQVTTGLFDSSATVDQILSQMGTKDISGLIFSIANEEADHDNEI
jgi:hypothetical protein